MRKTELLDAAFKKLAEAVKLLDSAGEELLADDAVELAERVNVRISAAGPPYLLGESGKPSAHGPSHA
jgi:hypothetical protein